MARASSPETAARWATARGLDLWVVVLPSDVQRRAFEPGLEVASADGAGVEYLPPAGLGFPAPFALFEAMRRHGVDDVRRTGLLAATPDVIEAGRRAGLGAVVAALDSVPAVSVTAADPDVCVDPSSFADLDAERFGSGRAHRPRVLLNPGPALTSERVKRAAAGLDLCHREPEYDDLRARVASKLRRAFHLSDDWATVLIAGSGTAAMEAMVCASTRPAQRLLVCRNGVYGDRIAAMTERAGIDHDVLGRPWTETIAAGEVEERLAADPAIGAVALVHHETTTGLLNPVREIAEAVSRQGRLVVLDAISSLGGEALDLQGSGIAMVACTANKCLHGLPGLAFVLLSPEGIERARAAPRRSVYLDLGGYLDASDRGTTPFTPSVPATYALEAALDELLEEGPDARRRRYRERVALLDREFERLGLTQLLPAGVRSSSIRSVRLPAGVAFADLHDPLRQDGYIIYAGQGELASTIFRVATLGNVEPPALEGFCARLQVALQVALERGGTQDPLVVHVTK